MTEEKNIKTYVTMEEVRAYTEAQCKEKLPAAVYESIELGKLFEALAKAQGEMETAKEESINPFFKSKYSDLASVVTASRPYLSKHGLCVIQRIMANGGGQSYLFTRLSHSSGQWMESRMNLLPTKADMQGMGSAITYAKRYAYSAMIGVVTGEDEDGNAACASSKPKGSAKDAFITQSQAKMVLDGMKGKDSQLMDKILEYYNINRLSFLPKSCFDECMRKIKSSGGNE